MPSVQSRPQPRSVEEITAKNVEAIAALDRTERQNATTSDRIASAITRFCGSMAFVWVHVVFFSGWIVWNTMLPLPKIDPYPFSFLTLVVSLEAIFLSTFIMISENRQEKLDERRSQLDLQINLLSEQENTKQLQLLKKVAEKLGIDASEYPEIAVMEQATRPEELAQQIDRSVEQEKKKDQERS